MEHIADSDECHNDVICIVCHSFQLAFLLYYIILYIYGSRFYSLASSSFSTWHRNVNRTAQRIENNENQTNSLDLNHLNIQPHSTLLPYCDAIHCVFHHTRCVLNFILRWLMALTHTRSDKVKFHICLEQCVLFCY